MQCPPGERGHEITLTGHLWSCRVRHGAGAWSHSPKCPRLRAVPGRMKERLGLTAGGDVSSGVEELFITPPLDNALLGKDVPFLRKVITRLF